MKMPYLHSNTRDRSRKRKWRVILFLVVCVGALSFLPFPGTTTSILHTIATPLWYARDAVVAYARTAFVSLEARGVLVGQVDVLRTRVGALEREVLRTRAYEREVRELEAMMMVREKKPDTIFGTVLQTIAYAPHDSFVVSVGSEDGVRNDMLVYTSDGYVVGAVSNVLGGTSMAQSLSASGVCTEAVLSSASSSVAVFVRGVGAGTMHILVPRDMVVDEGDIVHMSYDTWMVVGTVASVVFMQEDAYQTVLVRPPANIHYVRQVLVDSTHTRLPCEGDLLFSTSTEHVISGTTTRITPSRE